MSEYVSIKGWVEGSDAQMSEVERIIARARARFTPAFYMDGWCRPQPMNWTAFCFYGGNVSALSVADIRNLVKEIALIKTTDGGDVDYVSGVFYLDHENEIDKWQWELNKGDLVEKTRCR